MATRYHTYYLWLPGETQGSSDKIKAALGAAGIKYELESSDEQED